MTKNKISWIPPHTKQIICNKPKELYVIDITDIPKEIVNNSNNKEKYLLSIIDHFSKFF